MYDIYIYIQYIVYVESIRSTRKTNRVKRSKAPLRAEHLLRVGIPRPMCGVVS